MPSIANKITAPTVAISIEPNKPPVMTLSIPNKKLPNTAPTIPTRILPKSPNPLPFIIVPASQPASAPIIKNIILPHYLKYSNFSSFIISSIKAET